jgi:16S rRNA processing protein RimM
MMQYQSKFVWNISEILGFEVFDQHGEYLGILYEVLATGSNDIWIVRYYDEEILIPALKNIIKEVNIVRKKIFVSLPQEYESTLCNIQSLNKGMCSSDGYMIYED